MTTLACGLPSVRLGRYLAAVRAERGLTLEGLGAQVGCSRSYVCDVEKGYRRLSLEAAARWAKKIDLDRLLVLELALQDQLDAADLPYRVHLVAPSPRNRP